MKLIDIAKEVIDNSYSNIIEDTCPSDFDKRFPTFDIDSYTDKTYQGCRDISCEQCWNMEEGEIQKYIRDYEQKILQSYEQKSE